MPKNGVNTFSFHTVPLPGPRLKEPMITMTIHQLAQGINLGRLPAHQHLIKLFHVFPKYTCICFLGPYLSHVEVSELGV